MALLNITTKLTNYIFQRSAVIFPRLNAAYTHSSALINENEKAKNIFNTVNKLAEANNSRCFAIVHLMGKQYKVTAGDLLMVEGVWPPNLGDRIRLDKVLLAGSEDFSLVGQPLVQPGLVNVTATIIAKSLSHTRTRFRKKRRKQFMRINFIRQQQTTMRINAVDVGSHLNQPY